MTLRFMPPLCGAGLLLCMVHAQQPAGEAPAISTTANLVMEDIVVTQQGKPVRGLAAKQFHIFENGKEQRFTIFEERRPDATAEIGNGPQLPPNVFSNYPRYRATSATNVLLLDALNTPLSDQMYVRRQMIAYLKHVPPGTEMAVFTLASRLCMIRGFTSDAQAIAAAIGKGKGNPQQSVVLEGPQEQDEINDVATSMSSVDQGVLQQFVADLQTYQSDVRVRMTLDAMEQLGRYLSTIPGRKNLIWFSGSFPQVIGPDLGTGSTASNVTAPLDTFSPMRDYGDEVRRTGDLLSNAQVAVYPVDARGLMSLASVDASRSFATPASMGSIMAPGGRGIRAAAPAGAGGGPTAAQKADLKLLDQTTAEHEAMQQIAEETGGHAFYDNNGLKEAVARAIENGSNYYTIAYIPDAKTWDGSLRRIEVKVDGGPYDLEYRRGYYADDPRKATAHPAAATRPMLEALERGAPPLSEIAFIGRAVAADDPSVLKTAKLAPGPAGALAGSLHEPKKRYLVDCAVDPGGMTWIAQPGGGAQAKIEFSLVAWDEDGRRVNYTDRGLALELTSDRAAHGVKNGIPLHQEIDLPAGEVYLRIAVRDQLSGRIGSLEIPLKVAKR